MRPDQWTWTLDGSSSEVSILFGRIGSQKELGPKKVRLLFWRAELDFNFIWNNWVPKSLAQYVWDFVSQWCKIQHIYAFWVRGFGGHLQVHSGYNEVEGSYSCFGIRRNVVYVANKKQQYF
ncbi:hypothetical protein R6Q59_008843 [Mikania micrantha]